MTIKRRTPAPMQSKQALVDLMKDALARRFNNDSEIIDYLLRQFTGVDLDGMLEEIDKKRK